MPPKKPRRPTVITPRVAKAARDLFNPEEGVAKVNAANVKPEESRYRVCIAYDKGETAADVHREFKSALGKALTELGITNHYCWHVNVKSGQATTGRRVIMIKQQTTDKGVFYSLHEVPKQRFD